ncbi:MAG: imidazole glycerol phosphate synthase subunit HisF [Patescibacteria group bacterium]
MLVIPAIDIVGGKCVRLTQGDFAKSTLYSANPADVAKDFERQGTRFLHVVDLDGARTGFPVNSETILSIAKSVGIPIQIGGGIRSYDQARGYLEGGVSKIVLGTAVIENPKMLERVSRDFGKSRVTVSVDIKDGNAATCGWLKKSTETAPALIAALKKIGIASVIVTDTSKDGLLQGPNFGLTKLFIDEGFETIAAGGVTSLSDIREFTKLGAYGVIVGKAIYENKIDMRNAQREAAYKSSLAKRIIPCLDVKNGRVVKGTYFTNLRDAGDPVALGKKYCQQGADELILLDIAATLESRKTFCDLVSAIAREISIPFTVGGGITTIEDIRKLLSVGADKVSIGTAAVRNPRFIKDAAAYFGSQCIVISIDAKRQNEDFIIYIKGGTEKTEMDAVAFSKQMAQYGAGELLVNSLDRDGTQKGFDVELLKRVTDSVSIPVIASSGAGSMRDFLTVFEKTNVDAALGASIFHSQEKSIMELKRFLSSNNIPIRL